MHFVILLFKRKTAILEIEKIMYKTPKDSEKAFPYIAKGINRNMISHEIEMLLFYKPLSTLQTIAEDFLHPERNQKKIHVLP